MRTGFADLLGALHAGQEPAAKLIEGLAAGLRGSLLVVPTDGPGGVLTTTQNGVRWVFAFTGTTALAAFAAARGEGDREWAYRTVRGARLADVVAADCGPDAVLAIDVGGPAPMFLPAARVTEHAAEGVGR
jgi:hypothetical protein